MHTGQLSFSDSFEGSHFMCSPVMEATANHVSRGSTELSLPFDLGSQVPHWQQEAGIREELHSPVVARESVPQPGPAQGARQPPH